MKPLTITKEPRHDVPWPITNETTAVARRNPGLPAIIRRAPAVELTIRERPAPVPIPSLPPKQTYVAEAAEGFISRLFGASLDGGRRIQIELPFGTPRFTNAATLRQLLGGKSTDRLLKETAVGTWQICDDGMQVDLFDVTVRFRIGPIAVFS